MGFTPQNPFDELKPAPPDAKKRDDVYEETHRKLTQEQGALETVGASKHDLDDLKGLVAVGPTNINTQTRGTVDTVQRSLGLTSEQDRRTLRESGMPGVLSYDPALAAFLRSVKTSPARTLTRLAGGIVVLQEGDGRTSILLPKSAPIPGHGIEQLLLSPDTRAALADAEAEIGGPTLLIIRGAANADTFFESLDTALYTVTGTGNARTIEHRRMKVKVEVRVESAAKKTPAAIVKEISGKSDEEIKKDIEREAEKIRAKVPIAVYKAIIVEIHTGTIDEKTSGGKIKALLESLGVKQTFSNTKEIEAARDAMKIVYERWMSQKHEIANPQEKPTELSSVPLSEAQRTSLENAMKTIAYEIRDNDLFSCKELIALAKDIDPTFTLPKYLHYMETGDSSPDMIRHVAELEGLINLKILIPNGWLYLHELFGSGTEPQLVSGKITDWKGSVYGKVNGKNAYVFTFTVDARSSALASDALAHVRFGCMDPKRVGSAMEKQFEGYQKKEKKRPSDSDTNMEGLLKKKDDSEQKTIWHDCVRRLVQSGKLKKKNYVDTMMSRVHCEEGEHVIDLLLGMEYRERENSPPNPLDFIREEHHEFLKKQMSEIGDLWAQAFPSTLAPRATEKAPEEADIFFEKGIGELWANLRATIRLMQQNMKDNPETAKLLFYKYIGHLEEGHGTDLYKDLLRRMAQMPVGKKREKFVREAQNVIAVGIIHRLGDALVYKMLQEETGLTNDKEILDFVGEGGQQAAKKQLEILEKLERRLLHTPEQVLNIRRGGIR